MWGFKFPIFSPSPQRLFSKLAIEKINWKNFKIIKTLRLNVFWEKNICSFGKNFIVIFITSVLLHHKPEI